MKKGEGDDGGEAAYEDLVESTAALHLRARSAMARTAPMTMAVVCQQDFKYELFSVWSGGCGYVGSNAPIGKNRGQLWEK